MTALALCLQDKGIRITGSDSVQPQITDNTLKQRQIPVFEFKPENLNREIDLVIYSGAYQPAKHPEIIQAKHLQLPVCTLAEAISGLTLEQQTIAVCGVGGKTTTTSMLIKSFYDSNTKASWYVGVSKVDQKIEPGHFDPEGKIFITEADEYAISPPSDLRPKFALLNPDVVICTNLVHDHPDIYPDFAATLTVFNEFFRKIPANGLLLINEQVSQHPEVLTGVTAPVQTFGFSPAADWQIQSTPSGLSQHLELTGKPGKYQLNIRFPGQGNALNAAAAFITAKFLGLDPDKTGASLAEFSGTKRRLEMIKNQDGIIYFDDYGHHPLEIKTTLSALKAAYPGRRLIVAFQAHTYTRTKTLLNDFAASFSDCDQLIIAPIFASAREPVDPDFTAAVLASAIKSSASINAFEDFMSIVKYIKQIRQSGDIVLTIGAGNIYQIHQDL
jgi:UDP-N-acetylmuramate--alanine ligase